MSFRLLLSAITSLSLAGGAFATVHTFELNMTGDQEAPGPGDPDGFASGSLTIDDVTNMISWSFTYENIDAPTLMHIHTGAAGVPGPVLVNLGVATSGGPGTLISSTVASEANIKLILADPAGFYVNIHNAPFPAGAIRSQLLRLSDNCLGDFNGDGVVDGSDLGLLLGDWGGTEFDLNDDGAVDGSDLGILLGAWGDCVT